MRSSSCIRLLVLLAGTFCTLAHARDLTVGDYLDQVARKNLGYRGLELEKDAAITTGRSDELAFWPQLYSKLEYVNDPRDTQVPAIYGDHHINESFSAGVRGQAPFGLKYQLEVDVTRSRLFGIDPALVAHPDFFQVTAFPEFQFPLWQNWLGQMDRDQFAVNQAQTRANVLGKSYEQRAKLVEAEGRYWKLAVIREVARVQRQSLDRVKAMLELETKKQRKGLADPSDVLLAQSAVSGKELELQSVEDEMRAAARELNAARGVDSDEVPEDLPLPDLDTLRALEPPKRSGPRGDVEAAAAGVVAATAGADLAREKLLPELNLYGSIYAVGVNFSLPLNLGLTKEVKDGYAEQRAAAELSLEQKRFEEATGWNELLHKFEAAKRRLEIAVQLESVQQQKFELVQKRRERGLTVQDQVFQYELDYLNAMLARVQLEGTILGLRTEMKLYGSDG